MRATVLITGATGFIGSRLTARLVEQGREVWALIRPGSDTGRIRELLPALRIISGQLGRPEAWNLGAEEKVPPLCVHLAWYAEPGRYLDGIENLELLHDSLKMAQFVAARGCRRLVAAGTSYEYDTTFGTLAEATPTRPNCLYAAAKLSLFQLLSHLLPRWGMELAWARLFNPYGPGEDSRRLVPSLILALLEDREAPLTGGEQVRDFLHVDDLAAALAEVAQGNLQGPVNIGSGKPLAVKELAASLGRLLGKQKLLKFGALPYRPGEPGFVVADITRLKENTSWAPRFDLESGLADAVNWWRQRVRAGNEGATH